MKKVGRLFGALTKSNATLKYVKTKTLKIMRLITSSEFWGNVTKSPPEVANWILTLLQSSPSGSAKDDMISFLKEYYIPASLKAVELNSCNCAQTSVKNFLDELVDNFAANYQGVVRDDVVTAVMLDIRRQLQERYTNHKSCHPTANNDFVCYCDEHKH